MIRVGMYPWSSEFPVGISSERVMEHREVWERLSPAQLGGFSGSGLAPTVILSGILLKILPGVLGHLTCPHRTPLHSWDTPSHSPTPFPNPISGKTPAIPQSYYQIPFPSPIPQSHFPAILEHPQPFLSPISLPFLFHPCSKTPKPSAWQDHTDFPDFPKNVKIPSPK